jgi:small-conductance mechanosensitive channel
MTRERQSTENETESWKQQYRKEFMRSQELRQETKDAKTESSRLQKENAILSSQTKGAVRLVTAEYEAVIAKLRTELAKAESLYKVLLAKDEQTGDDLRRRAASATRLEEEVRHLREELAAEVAEKTAPELKPGEPSFLVENISTKLLTEVRYMCQVLVDEARCTQCFDSPKVL